MAGKEDSVKYTTTLDFKLEENTLLICDELDYFLYNDPYNFLKVSQGLRLIGFTGTAAEEGVEGIEDLTIKNFKFS